MKRASEILLPPGEFDGLSPASTERAAQQFVHHIKSLVSTPAQQESIDEAFSNLGFAALRQEAVSSNSLLLVFLHSPLQHESAKFCQVYTEPSMLDFLKQDHMKALGSSIRTSQGSSLSYQLGAASFPLLALLQPGRGSADGMKMVFKAEGPALLKMQPTQLLSLMTATYHHHLAVVTELEARRIEREQEVELRRQQDAEYEEALLADQERERQRQDEREKEERRIREEEEIERRTAQLEQDRLSKAKEMLRPEPSSGGARIRFVLPSGQKIDRRFEDDETIGALKAFLVLHFAEQYPEIKNVALTTNFPKQTHTDERKTLKESGLCPQSAVMVQDLDA